MITDAQNQPVSLSQLNRLTGISISHLSRVLNGRRRPSVENLQRIAAALGKDINDLCSDLDQKKAEQC